MAEVSFINLEYNLSHDCVSHSFNKEAKYTVGILSNQEAVYDLCPKIFDKSQNS